MTCDAVWAQRWNAARMRPDRSERWESRQALVQADGQADAQVTLVDWVELWFDSADLMRQLWVA